jgi:hypothetical protein
MPNIYIRRIADDRYTVRQYDEVLSVQLGDMNVDTLAQHLRFRDLIERTAEDVINSLNVGDETTVQFRTLF